jgi:hypothetical protein
MFLLYRDIILKSVNSSFELNLLYYFIFFNDLNFDLFDDLKFFYLISINGDKMAFLDYLSKQDLKYSTIE